MSRLLDAIQAIVPEMTTNDWSFYLGTLPEQNIKSDDIKPPVVMLRAPINSTSVLQPNSVFLTSYQLIFSFLELRDPVYTAIENSAVIDRCNAGKIELFTRLQQYKTSQGVRVFQEITNISTLELYREYDTSWAGVLVSATVLVQENLTTCLSNS